jgi:hypothetical protein
MNKDLKGDILIGAYAQMRVSGLTVAPSPSELDIGLTRLENMMAELAEIRNICIGYNFEDNPNPNSLHNCTRGMLHFMETNTAVRLLPDYGLDANPVLLGQAAQSMSGASAYSARKITRQVDYPSRQPRGGGNMLRANNWRRFYLPIEQAPADCDTHVLNVGDIDDFTEHFDSYLASGEEVASYTIEETSGLSVVSDSLTSPDVSYRIEALGATLGDFNSAQRVKLVATTDAGRVETRYIYFRIEIVDD